MNRAGISSSRAWAAANNDDDEDVELMPIAHALTPLFLVVSPVVFFGCPCGGNGQRATLTLLSEFEYAVAGDWNIEGMLATGVPDDPT